MVALNSHNSNDEESFSEYNLTRYTGADLFNHHGDKKVKECRQSAKRKARFPAKNSFPCTNREKNLSHPRPVALLLAREMGAQLSRSGSESYL